MRREAQRGCAAQRLSSRELENSSQEESVPEEFGNKPEVVVSPSVSTYPSLAAGLERDEQSDKQDACHDVEDTRVEGPGEVCMVSATRQILAVQQEETL